MTETSRPRSRQFGRRHEAVAAIVAAPGDHQDWPLLHEVHRGLGYGLARAQHQREAWSTRSNGKPIGTLHLGGSQNFHAKFPMQAPYPEAVPGMRIVQPDAECIPIDLFAYFLGCRYRGRFWPNPKDAC